MEAPRQRPAQLGYSREMGWHWLLMDDNREVAGLLIPGPDPRHHQGVWELVELDTLRERNGELEAELFNYAVNWHQVEHSWSVAFRNCTHRRCVQTRALLDKEA